MASVDNVRIEMERSDGDSRANVEEARSDTTTSETSLSKRTRLLRACIPIGTVVIIIATILILVAWNRDGIKDVLDELNPSQSVAMTIAWLCIGCGFIWLGLFFPASIFVLATGYFYELHFGLIVLYIWIVIGIVFEYYVGRYCAKHYLTVELMRRWFPHETKYFLSFKKAFREEPYKLSFLIVSAPIPLGFNLILIGIFTDVDFFPYFSMAMASCTLFMVPVCILASNADNLEDALDPSGSILDFVILLVSIVISIVNLVYIPRVVGRNLRRYSRSGPELESELPAIEDTDPS